MTLTFVTPNDQNFIYDRSKVLGQGGFGTVFKGKYNGNDVAVKRLELVSINKKSMEEKLLATFEHDNVVKLFCVQENKDFRFYALELCDANLDHYCKGDYIGTIPSDVKVLYQLAIGLEYIHSKGCIHRDIKPENILISKPDPHNVKMKWADFGLSKAINKNGSCSISGKHGTTNWRAPELFRLREDAKGRGSTKSDIFSAGLVFFYFLKRGLHPFGENRDTIDDNIKNDKKANMHELGDDHFAKDFITNMIAHVANNRIALKQIIQELGKYLANKPSVDAAGNQLPVNEAAGVQTVFSPEPIPGASAELPASMGPPSVPLSPPKKRAVRKQPKDNIMSIADVRSKTIKKLRCWAIKAKVTDRPSPFTMESHTTRILGRKCFYVTLEDESGTIRARACGANIFKKFVHKFQKGQRYLIKKVKMVTLDSMEPILSLRTETEISSC